MTDTQETIQYEEGMPPHEAEVNKDLRSKARTHLGVVKNVVADCHRILESHAEPIEVDVQYLHACQTLSGMMTEVKRLTDIAVAKRDVQKAQRRINTLNQDIADLEAKGSKNA